MTNNNAHVAFWNRAQRIARSKYALKLRNKLNSLFSIWLSCGLLVGAAITALVAWYLYSPSGSTSQVISPSEVCDVMPLDKPTRAASGYFTVRFVSYGDVDSDDDVPCGMLPDVRIPKKYASPVDSDVLAHDWVHVVTTDPDGLAETALVPGDYLICALNYSEPICLYENLPGGRHKFEIYNFEGSQMSIRKR